jgi:hypothetical protein
VVGNTAEPTSMPALSISATVWVSLWVSIPPNTTFSVGAAGIEDVMLAMSALLVKKRTKGSARGSPKRTDNTETVYGSRLP